MPPALPRLLRVRRRTSRRRASRCARSAITRARSSSITFFELVDEHEPLHVSIVGGEPLVRFRELNEILPRLAERGIYSQVVTSAVRPIPIEWASIPRLQMVVSIDGLQPEHDVRRKPATYDRILKHIDGHQITVHCTVTRQQVQRDGYLEEFVDFWSANPNVRTDLGQPVHAADRRGVGQNICGRKTASASSPR